MLCLAYFPPNGDEWGVYLFFVIVCFLLSADHKNLEPLEQTFQTDVSVCVRGWTWIHWSAFLLGLKEPVWSSGVPSIRQECLVISAARTRPNTSKGTHTVRRNVLTVSNPTPDDDLLRLNTAQHDCLLWQGTNACEARPRLTSMRAL